MERLSVKSEIVTNLNFDSYIHTLIELRSQLKYYIFPIELDSVIVPKIELNSFITLEPEI